MRFVAVTRGNLGELTVGATDLSVFWTLQCNLAWIAMDCHDWLVINWWFSDEEFTNFLRQVYVSGT